MRGLCSTMPLTGQAPRLLFANQSLFPTAATSRDLNEIAGTEAPQRALAPAVPNERRWLEVRAGETVQRTMSAAGHQTEGERRRLKSTRLSLTSLDKERARSLLRKMLCVGKSGEGAFGVYPRDL